MAAWLSFVALVRVMAVGKSGIKVEIFWIGDALILLI